MRRSERIRAALFVALAVAGAPPAQAQNPPVRRPAAAAPAPAAAPAAAAANPQRLEELLNNWQQNSARLKSLDVDMTRVDKSGAWGDEYFEGRAMLKSPNLAFLDFKKETEVKNPKNGAPQKVMLPYERLICTGTEVWHFRCDTKQIFIYPLEKDVQQRALEEGPLPFLFNFNAEAARKRYEMALVAENTSFSLIRIIPLLEMDQAAFSKALVVLDRKLYLLPVRITMVGPDGKSSKEYLLKMTKDTPIKPVDDDNFQPKELAGWKVVRNPAGDAGIAAPGGGGAPAQRPAMRPRPPGR